MDWILWIIPPFPTKHQKDDDDDDVDDDDDSLEVWSNVRVGGNNFYCQTCLKIFPLPSRSPRA